MLLLEAEIYFDEPHENPEGLSCDLDTKNILRPAINFGNDELFSGTILAKANVKNLMRGKFYEVTIEMPTIEEEAYEMIRGLLQIGNKFVIQAASRVIGKGKILDYLYF